MYRKDVIARIGEVERQHRAAALALARLDDEARRDPTVLGGATIDPADVRACRAGLEATYLARLFAVFESQLRDVWESAFARATHPKMTDLLDGCAARQNVPDDLLTAAHRTRECRNAVVHGGEADYVPLADARANLCAFFGRMPPEW